MVIEKIKNAANEQLNLNLGGVKLGGLLGSRSKK